MAGSGGNMQGLPDISTVELTRTRLKLRDDLLFIPQQYGGESYYHIEVSTSSEFYRIGYAEYVFVSLLNGKTSFAEALAATSQKLGTGSLSQYQAMTLYSWLLENGLATFSDEDATASGAASTVRASSPSSRWWKTLNPLWLKVPLGCPEAFLKALQSCCGWLFSVPSIVLSLLLMLAAAVVLYDDWGRFWSTSENVISSDNWKWLLAAWIGLKCVHESAHGLVCLRYGGRVREIGFVLAVFTPLAYIDASSSWAFRCRWQRIHTAVAGIHIELLIAAVSIMLWSYCDSIVIRHVLQNLIVMASISTLVFNLNPLMRFDGYYILSDLLQIPNLMSESTQVLSSTFRRLFFGESSTAPRKIGRQRMILLTFGLLASFWRVLISVSILIAASVLFHGAGIALAAIGGLLWFGKPLWKLLTELQTMRLQQPERLVRAAAVTAFCGSAIAFLIFAVPAPVMITAPGIVEYTDGEVIRAQTAGFVRQIHVTEGQNVVEGELLLSLRNDEITSKHDDLAQKIAQQELRMQTANRDHDGGALSVAQMNLESMRSQLEECQQQLAGLELRAKRAGCVVAPDLNRLNGTFAKPGQELMTIGREDQKELQISVGQRDLARSLQAVGQKIRVRIGTHRGVDGTLQRINPQASRNVPHPAMAASNGGALPVVGQTDASGNDEARDAMRLTEHRFTGIVILEPEQALQLRCGERGTACPGLVPASLGIHCWRSACRWFESKFVQ